MTSSLKSFNGKPQALVQYLAGSNGAPANSGPKAPDELSPQFIHAVFRH